MTNTICHFEIPADDPASARDFYAELFGWEIVPAPGTEGGFFILQAGALATPLSGGIRKRALAGEGPTLYVTVASVEDAARAAVRLGGHVLAPRAPVTGVGWLATIQDPQGNVLGLYQEDKAAG